MYGWLCGIILLEARVQHEPRRRRIAEDHRHDRAERDHQQPVVEHQPLEGVAGVAVEIRDIANDRHLLEVVRNGGHRWLQLQCAPLRRATVAVTATPRGPTSARRPSPASATPVSGIGCLRATLVNVRAAIVRSPRRDRPRRRAAIAPSACSGRADDRPRAGPTSTLTQLVPRVVAAIDVAAQPERLALSSLRLPRRRSSPCRAWQAR